MIIRLAHCGNESFVFGLHRAASGRRFCDAEVARVGGLLAPLVSTLSRLRLAEELERLRGGNAVAVPGLSGPTPREPDIPPHAPGGPAPHATTPPPRADL